LVLHQIKVIQSLLTHENESNRSVRKRQNECDEENESVYFVLVFLIVSLILDKFVKEKYISDKRLSATVSAQAANP
jgi:hypothetical protein